jgi:hypothetical protein
MIRRKSRLVLCAVLLSTMVVVAGCPVVVTLNGVRIANESFATVTAVFIVPSDSAGWGADLLEGDTIEPGESLTFGGLANGLWDIRIDTDAGFAVFQFDQFLVGSETFTYVVLPPK